jgi:hypothetical protein
MIETADLEAERRAEYIARLLADAPTPTPEQVARVCGALRSASRNEPLTASRRMT